jgi:hypothetical protein
MCLMHLPSQLFSSSWLRERKGRRPVTFRVADRVELNGHRKCNRDLAESASGYYLLPILMPTASTSRAQPMRRRKSEFEDWRRIQEFLAKRRNRPEPNALTDLLRRTPVTCLRSNRVAQGTRIATFSFRKALEFPMFQISAKRYL